jgi:oligopeptidase A
MTPDSDWKHKQNPLQHYNFRFFDTDNPLMPEHEQPLNQLPDFAKIQVAHIVPAVEAVTGRNLAALEARLDALEATHDAPEWSFFVALDDDADDLSRTLAPVSHLHAVKSSPELRDAYNTAQSILSRYYTSLGQNARLFKAYNAFYNSPNFSRINLAVQNCILHPLRDFRLSGIDLSPPEQARYGEIQAELTQLTTQFSNQVLDATQAWCYHTTDLNDLAGLPASQQEAAAETARRKGVTGYLLTLDGPVYQAVMTYADSRELRETFYRAYTTRASDIAPPPGQTDASKRHDNGPLIDKILQLRQELAQLLGFRHFAELSLETKMAESPEQVIAFLHDLATKARPGAERDLAELQSWVASHCGLTTLEHWDIAYYSEKLREAKYSLSSETVRHYFTLPRVLRGVFGVAEKLFDLTIEPADAPSLWHDDAAYYNIYRNGRLIAGFYLDLFAREGKRGGAWMDDCLVRRLRSRGMQNPVAFLVCNFQPPTGDKPALLMHDDVTTLFHELGHGLHHMLTQMEFGPVSGINGVEWDAVELPSQLLENWCWQPEVLSELSAHHETGDCLSQDLIAKMLAAKNFQSGLFLLRQIEFALFDITLHSRAGEANFPGVQATLDQVRQAVALIIPPAFNRFQNTFTHIFAGGYAAGYYSYLWAEVLSADAFAAFEETGIFNCDTGERFLKQVLSQGGSQSAATLFRNFRGRAPEVDAFLRHNGIAG